MKMTTAQMSNKHNQEFGFQHTLMNGRYTESLGAYAKEQAAKLREQEQQRKKEEKERIKELRIPRGKWATRFLRIISFIWRHTFAKIGEDWVFLAILGIIMALISFVMDFGIKMCNTARYFMFNELTAEPILQYFAWISLPVCLILFSAGFVYILAPQAIGSGIPEMKTILRGVVLKEYLTFRTLVAKVVGLTATLGSGMPVGKEGPLVHIASIVATLMSKMVTSFNGIYENESRSSEMLAAACAVGVSCCVGAPIGGVLFSIEVTSVYFAVRNYWRGFCSAVFSAVTFSLLVCWFTAEETITSIFQTSFRVDFAYDPHELFVFALIGVFGGLSGALYVLCHRTYVLFMRKNKMISSFLQKNRFIYPGIVSLFIATVYFPLGTGQFLATTMTNRQQITSLFSNFTWISDDLTVEQAAIVAHWNNPYCGILVNLSIYVVTTFFLTLLASTLPVPSGSLIPNFKIGAAFGRIIGEVMNLWFPPGFHIGAEAVSILPGGYAIVGAAAFSSGVTHAISICVIVSEMTGQIYFIIPVLVAVLVSNAISTLLQPSLYDSVIMIKKLPYLPTILHSKSAAHDIRVENFMIRDIRYIWKKMSHKELKTVLKENPRIHSFPLVQCPEQMILLGSIQRNELVDLIEHQIGNERRKRVAVEREMAAQKRICEGKKPLIPISYPANEVTESSPHPPVQRKVSRFEVQKVPDDSIIQNTTGSHNSKERQQLTLTPSSPEKSTPFSVQSSPTHHDTQRQTKSILKKTNSLTSLPIQVNGQAEATNGLAAITSHATVTGTEGRKLRQAIGVFIRKSSMHFINGGSSTFGHRNHSKKVTLPKIIDMTPEEQKEWEESEMQKPIDLSKCQVDPAPFQLVERTSLLKVHSMFSLMGFHHAYVTNIGKLVGIVCLKDLRKAIEDVNAGIIPYRNNNNSSSNGADKSDKEMSHGSPIDLENGTEMQNMSSTDSYVSDSESDSDDNQGESIALTHSTLVHKSASISSLKIQKSSSVSSLNMHLSATISTEAAVSHQQQQRRSIKFVVTSVNEPEEDNIMDVQDSTEKT